MERLAAKWHEDRPCAFVLGTEDESFNERDTSVLANDAEAGCDPLVIAPALERITPELLALDTDDVFRDGTCVVDGAFEEALNGFGRGIVLKCCEAHHTMGVVVDGCHALIGAVMRPALRRDLRYAGLLDAEFFTQQGTRFVEPIVYRRQSAPVH